MAAAPNAAVKALQLEMRNISKDPIEGVLIELQDESNLFEWNVGVFGPPKTLYEGGYFKVRIYVSLFILLNPYGYIFVRDWSGSTANGFSC